MDDKTVPCELNLFTLYSLSKQALEDASYATDGVKLVFDVLQDKLARQDFQSVDNILKELHVALLHADIIVSILNVTKPHPNLKERAYFYDRAFAHIHVVDDGRTDRYIESLK